MEREEGAFNDAIVAERTKFTKKTENVEIMLAFQLAAFYFPDDDAELCFMMRRDFSPASASSYDAIVAGIENDTAIDCTIKSDGREFNFQIKRCPQDYIVLTRDSLTAYIKKAVAGYGDMRGTILILLLQPNTEAANNLSFKQVHEDMAAMKDTISFDEIDFVFNDRNQNIRWQQVFPQYGHAEQPLVLLSEKYQKQQEEWRQTTA
jgi:hypothetical protein